MKHLLAQSRRLGFAGQAAVLTGLMLLPCAAGLTIGWWQSGRWGALAASIAAAACWTGAILALLVSARLRHPTQALAAMVLSMAARTGLPLAALLVISSREGSLSKAGLLYYSVVFYMIALAAETLLSLPSSQPVDDKSDSQPNTIPFHDIRLTDGRRS